MAATGVAVSAHVIKPRSTMKMRPVTQAIQLALFRRDSDGVQRVVKLGELIVREAMKGDKQMIAIVAERMDGKIIPASDEHDAPADLGNVLVSQLIEALVDKKMAERTAPTAARDVTSATVVEDMVRTKR